MQQVPAAAMVLALESLERAGRLRLKVNGTSMIPAVYPGSYALIRRAGAGEVSRGDIVLTRFGDGVRLHRLQAFMKCPPVAGCDINRQGTLAPVAAGDRKAGVFLKCDAGDQIVTRGDNHQWDDPPCAAESLIGVLVEIEQGPPLAPRLGIAARLKTRVSTRLFQLASRFSGDRP